MTKKLIPSATIALLIMLVGCGGGGSSSSSNPGTGGGNPGGGGGGSIQSINHIVFMLQENRSFDSYFGHLNAYRQANGLGPDVDGLDKVANPANPTRDGSQMIPSFEMVSACSENVSPSWNESHVQRNRHAPDTTSQPLMDGFVQTANGYAVANGLTDIIGKRAMGYYDDTHLPYYYFLATKFATSDRWFSPIMSKSEPNRLFAFAATSAGNVSVPQQTVSSKTIWHLLEAAGITWKVYLSKPGVTMMGFFQPFSSQHQDHIVPLSEYFDDLAKGTLPQVSFVETTAGLDEHPDANVQIGAQHAESIINAFMQSTAWKDGVFFLSYDEGGGLYDHVPPLQTVNPDGIPPTLGGNNPNSFSDNFTFTGFRVPLIVLSPFTRPGFVSHTPADFTAILKFIETRFNLPNLNARDAAQPDIQEFFDFNNPQWLTPPNPPNQPASSPCYYNRLP